MAQEGYCVAGFGHKKRRALTRADLGSGESVSGSTKKVARRAGPVRKRRESLLRWGPCCCRVGAPRGRESVRAGGSESGVGISQSRTPPLGSSLPGPTRCDARSGSALAWSQRRSSRPAQGRRGLDRAGSCPGHRVRGCCARVHCLPVFNLSCTASEKIYKFGIGICPAEPQTLEGSRGSVSPAPPSSSSSGHTRKSSAGMTKQLTWGESSPGAEAGLASPASHQPLWVGPVVESPRPPTREHLTALLPERSENEKSSQIPGTFRLLPPQSWPASFETEKC
ncbi:uncharacterized protein LOC117063666 [Trachypithecus francoisi]|uniref:uncharacterized protein LOC117063666 n=1 Tax=Trachypithecus francoisi TaxID=54180 RepID=UPI00141AF566|nr:uncharacterized protein LOC117063666 [Trachypithecus francoisi]